MGRRRRSGTVIVAVAVVALLVAGGVFLASRGSKSSAHAAQLVTAVARRGTLTQTVDAPFTLALAGTQTLAGPSSISGAGIVNQVSLAAGETVPQLQPLLQIDGTPVFGIATPVPLYRDLGPGDTGPDVQAVQAALTFGGYSTGGIDGTFGASTSTAIDAFQAAQGVSQTGTLSLAQFVWFSPGSVVLDLKVSPGQKLAAGGPLADLTVPGELVAEADVTQSDFTSVKAGQQAQLSFDAFPDAQETGVVQALPLQAESSSSSGAGSSSPVNFSVDISPQALPQGAKAGMTGQASIIVTSREHRDRSHRGGRGQRDRGHRAGRRGGSHGDPAGGHGPRHRDRHRDPRGRPAG